MLVFIDESGDSGLKIDQGSSRYFVVSLVVFKDLEEASKCDCSIEQLKAKLQWKANSEFHFFRNANNVRKSFLQTVSSYSFSFYSIVINKDPQKLWGEGFKDKRSFYKFACKLVFENAKEVLEGATVVIDKSGDKPFQQQLSKYLKSHMNTGIFQRIKKVKMQHSHSNNLLQLADYVASLTNRMYTKKDLADENLYSLIIRQEERVQIWPPK